MTYPRTCYACEQPINKLALACFHYNHLTKTASSRHASCPRQPGKA